MPFRVLFVCTGNLCRSPLAERLLISRLAGGQQIDAASAGTNAVVGHAMDEASAAVLRELGGDPDGHVARQLDDASVAAADLILTANLAHRETIMSGQPSAMRKTFTLREFGRLGAGLAPARPGPAGSKFARRVSEVAAQRGRSAPARRGADDIGDPLGAPYSVVRDTGRVISDALDQLLRSLGLPAAEPGDRAPTTHSAR